MLSGFQFWENITWFCRFATFRVVNGYNGEKSAKKTWQRATASENKAVILRISIQNEIQLDAHTHTGGQSLKREDGRIGIATFQLADIALGNPGLFGKLFLGHAGLEACINQRLDGYNGARISCPTAACV